MIQFTAEDDEELKVSKREIEEVFEREKWSMVAAAMAKKGRDGFAAASLKKRFGQLA